MPKTPTGLKIRSKARRYCRAENAEKLLAGTTASTIGKYSFHKMLVFSEEWHGRNQAPAFCLWGGRSPSPHFRCGQSRDSGDQKDENCTTDGELIELCLLATLRSALAPLEALCRNTSSSATLASSHFPGRCPFQNTKKAGSPALNARAKKLSSAFPPSIR